MSLQDLTPQLRTRLSRLEWWVGIFVLVATVLLLAGLAFYFYHIAENKGWFQRKLPYFTFVRSAAGLKTGQKVKLMGLDVGQITEIVPQPPWDPYDMYVAFYIHEPYEGYIWEDSRALVGAGDFLGNRFIEITKGTNGPATYLFRRFREVSLTDAAGLIGAAPAWFADQIQNSAKTKVLARPLQPVTREVLDEIGASAGLATVRLIETTNESKMPTGIWEPKEGRYFPFHKETSKGYFLLPEEAPALTARMEKVADLVEGALPNILALTNRLQQVLDGATETAAQATRLLTGAEPTLTNLFLISSHLTNENGSLGQWLLSAPLKTQLQEAVEHANGLLTNTDARLTQLAVAFDLSLENLANITSNLHRQVDANTNLVGDLSQLLIDTDNFVQGLKRHWLLRSAFKSKSAPASKPDQSTFRKVTSPKDSDR